MLLLLLFERRAAARFPSFDSWPCPVCTCAEHGWECAHAHCELKGRRLRPRNRTRRCRRRQNRNTRPKAVVAPPSRPGTWTPPPSSRTTWSSLRRLESMVVLDGAAWWWWWWPPLRKEFLPSCLERHWHWGADCSAPVRSGCTRVCRPVPGWSVGTQQSVVAQTRADGEAHGVHAGRVLCH